MTDNTGTVDTVINMTVPGNKVTKQYNILLKIIRLILLYTIPTTSSLYIHCQGLTFYHDNQTWQTGGNSVEYGRQYFIQPYFRFRCLEFPQILFYFLSSIPLLSRPFCRLTANKEGNTSLYCIALHYKHCTVT